MQISHDPRSHDPDPAPQEKSMKKSCISFETECIHSIRLGDVHSKLEADGQKQRYPKRTQSDLCHLKSRVLLTIEP